MKTETAKIENFTNIEAIKDKLKKAIREPRFARQNRVDSEFQALKQGKSSHAEFRSLYEEMIEDMELAEITYDADFYFRKYLCVDVTLLITN